MKLVTFAAVLGLVATAALPSCSHSSAHQLCDLQCDCEKCSDRYTDECVIVAGQVQDVANAYDCDSQRQDYDDCLIHVGDCNDLHWEYPANACAAEFSDLCDCVDAASDYPDVYLLQYYGCPVTP